METRKIQKVGASTLTVSLPKDWAAKHGLRRGDSVSLLEEGDALKLVPLAAAHAHAEGTEYIVDADLCDSPGMLERVIVGNYVLGRNRITVRASSRLRSEHWDEIRGVTRRVMGLGILEETTNRVVLHSSIDPSQYPLDTLLKRLYNLSYTMLEESIDALFAKDKNLAEDAIRREDDADMMYWLCLRLILSAQVDDSLLEKVGVKNRVELAGYRLIAKDLETVADHGEEIARTVLDLLNRNKKLPLTHVKVLKELTDGVAKIYTKAIAALLTRDIRSANESIELRRELWKKEQALMKDLFERTKDPAVLLAFRNIVHGIGRMAEYATSIAVIATNRYLERPTALCRPAPAKA